MKRRHIMMEGRNMKKVLLVAAVVILVAAGAGTTYYLTFGRINDKTDEVEEKPYPDPVLTDSQEKIEKILAEGQSDLDDKTQELKKAESSADSDTDKAAYALAQVDLYASSDQADTALEKALEAERKYQTADTAAVVAALYNERKDYAQAAAYYQKAADRSEKTESPTQRSPYNDYMNSKREAEAKL